VGVVVCVRVCVCVFVCVCVTAGLNHGAPSEEKGGIPPVPPPPPLPWFLEKKGGVKKHRFWGSSPGGALTASAAGAEATGSVCGSGICWWGGAEWSVGRICCRGGGGSVHVWKMLESAQSLDAVIAIEHAEVAVLYVPDGRDAVPIVPKSQVRGQCQLSGLFLELRKLVVVQLSALFLVVVLGFTRT
jgi:hypothetical protein